LYYADRTLKETGAALGIGVEATRQIQTKVIRELRRPKYADQLRPYVNEQLRAASFHHVGVAQFDRTWTSATEYAALYR